MTEVPAAMDPGSEERPAEAPAAAEQQEGGEPPAEGTAEELQQQLATLEEQRAEPPPGYEPHVAASTAEDISHWLVGHPLSRYVDEAVDDLEGNEENGKYVTPAYRFALEKMRANLKSLVPYREAVEAMVKAILDREATELERQQLRAAQILQHEEDEINAHLTYKDKAIEAKRVDEERQRTEIRRIENVYAGELKKILQEKNTITKEVEFDIEEKQIHIDSQVDRLTRETTSEIDDLLHEFESWKTQQLLELQEKQAKIFENSSAAKEELAADLDKLKAKIEYHEAEIMKVKLTMVDAENAVEKGEAELEAAQTLAADTLALAETASLSFKPQEERLAEIQTKRIEETSKKEAVWTSQEEAIREEEARRHADAKARFEEVTKEHAELIKAQKEDLERQQHRAEKELALCEQDLKDSSAKIDEANKAALDARDALAAKERECKETKEAAVEKLKALETQQIHDAAMTLQTFENKRTTIESQFIRGTEEVKEEMDKERENLLKVRDQMVSAAKEEATKSRVMLDREYVSQEEKLKAVYQEIGYARAQVQDTQDVITDEAERHTRAVQEYAEKHESRTSEFQKSMEVLSREQVEAAAAADKEAEMVRQRGSPEEREAAAAAVEDAIAASRSELLETCDARVQELKEQFTILDQEAGVETERTVQAAQSTVDSASTELEDLKANMGQRGELIQAGIGAVDEYSTILAKTEQRLVADREFVASEVERDSSELAALKEECQMTMQKAEAACQEAIADSAAELRAEEKAIQVANEELQAELELQKKMCDAKVTAWKQQLEGIALQRRQEEEHLSRVEVEIEQSKAEAEADIARLADNEEEAAVEHIPGVTLSVDIRINAAKCKIQGAQLRLAVLKSDSSPLGNLRLMEQTLTDKIREVEDDLARQAEYLKKHIKRSGKTLEVKKQAHESLKLLLEEELQDKREEMQATVNARKMRVDARKAAMEQGWNKSQSSLGWLISDGESVAKALTQAARAYTEEDDSKLRSAIRKLTSAWMAEETVGLDRLERDIRAAKEHERHCNDLVAQVSQKQVVRQSKISKLDELRRVAVARAVEQRRVEELYTVAGLKADAAAREQRRQQEITAEAEDAAKKEETEYEARKENFENALAAARKSLEEALKKAAEEEEKMTQLKARYEEVMVKLDARLDEARNTGAGKLEELQAQKVELRERRDQDIADVLQQEEDWKDRTQNKATYHQQMVDGNAADIQRVEEEVEEMREFVAKADEAASMIAMREQSEQTRRQAESQGAQAHYQKKMDAIGVEIERLLGNPTAEYNKAVAEIGPVIKEQLEDIEDEKSEHQAICEVYLEEESVLQRQIDELRKEAGEVLQQAEAHKAVVADLEQKLSAARSELEVQKSRHSAVDVENKRALNVFEADAATVTREIEQIDNDVNMDIEDLQDATNAKIKEREDDAIAIREQKMEVLNGKVKVLKDEFEQFKSGKMEFLRIEVERLGEGEWEAEQDMTEQMEKVASLAAEREAARKTAQEEALAYRTQVREIEQQKDEEAAVQYEEEMQTMHEDLETMNTAYRKAEDMHRIALEEEQVRERARVEEVTRAELQVELRKKQESARLLFEKEKDRLRKEAEALAMEAEAELQAEEEKALAVLRAKRKERLQVVEEKKASLRGRLEKTYVQQQVKLAEEHLEKEREKMSLVQKTFGFFGKKSIRPSSAERLRKKVQSAGGQGQEEQKTAADDRPQTTDSDAVWEEKAAMERELAKLEAEMQALQAVADI